MMERSVEEYEEMARAAMDGEFTPSGPPEDGSTLVMGRPRKGAEEGVSPVRAVRFPQQLLDDLERYAAETHTTTSEVVRRAAIEYLARHQESA
ncbi:ribbon-helix-helix domain-containing protein [Gordonia sp. CPCC 205515]|uniref:ribbon-helix-helix domain-containing protein n=1 Tax=Gordonia sp. CPCC 205515 TaxID=3140791 RepID=UPI003AF403EB